MVRGLFDIASGGRLPLRLGAILLAPLLLFGAPRMVAGQAPVPGAGSPAAAPPAASPTVPPPVAAPAPQGRTGLIGELNKLFETSNPLPPLKSPAEVIEEWNAKARDAGEDFNNRLGKSLVVTGRVICPVSANGAPDCEPAAGQLCRDKGFKGGRGLDIDSARVCSPQAVLSGRTSEPNACRMENYVTRALCQ